MSIYSDSEESLEDENENGKDDDEYIYDHNLKRKRK